MKKEDIIWYEHVRETGTGALTCVDKIPDNHQKYRRYREELDDVVAERKSDVEQQIVILEDSTCNVEQQSLEKLLQSLKVKDKALS